MIRDLATMRFVGNLQLTGIIGGDIRLGAGFDTGASKTSEQTVTQVTRVAATGDQPGWPGWAGPMR